MQTNIQPIVGNNQQLIVILQPNTLQPMVVNTHQSKKDFSARLDKALTHAGIPPDRNRIGRVAKMFGVSREAVRKWLSGESIPDTKRISDLSHQTGVKGEWLLTGHGSMRYGDGSAEEARCERFPPHILQLARLISQAPPEKVQAILVLLGEKDLADPPVQHTEPPRKIEPSPHVIIESIKKPMKRSGRPGKKRIEGENNG
jgi:hypothetical protein